MPIFRNLSLAIIELLLGTLLGFGFLEVILDLNTYLLLQGMNAPAPISQPLQDQNYQIFYSDADLFYWHNNLIKPIPPEDDRLEAQVHYQTDEFGFPNRPPLPSQVDVVVLGSSESIGAQSSQPWTRQLTEETGLRVFNLSQSGSDIEVRYEYLRRFGMSRQPRWVIIEILSSLDILGYAPGHHWIKERMLYILIPYVFIQEFASHGEKDQNNVSSGQPIFPLPLSLPGRQVMFTDFTRYLSTLTVDQKTIQASRNWAEYSQELLELINYAQDNGACVLLLIAPTKSEIYLPLAQTLEELWPIQRYMIPWRLDDQKWLVQDSTLHPDLYKMQSNARTSHDLLINFASNVRIPLIDPSKAMMQSALQGDDPFLEYDTHWSLAGHQIVARAVSQVLQNVSCP